MANGSKWIAAAALIGALVGCGPSLPPSYEVAGTVSYRGQPVPAGIVYFDPDIAEGIDGPQGFAVIKQGKFDTRDMGQKVGSGKYVARIYAHDGVPAPEFPMGKPLLNERTLPLELPAADSTQTLDIPGGT